MPVSIITFFVKRVIDRKNPNPFKTSLKTICVGNAVMGGGGKTPTVIELNKQLKKLYPNKKIVVISKGYKGKITGPHIVDNKDLAIDVGDEPCIIAREANVIVSKDRLKGLKFAEENGYEIAIFDDGLHDKRINYDISYLVIDGEYGFGNNLVFPAGPLRDRIDYACKNADEIIIIGKDEKDILKKLGRRVKKDFRIHRAAIKITNLIDTSNIYVAFAGLARPSKFFNTLEKMKAGIVEKIDFPDHHNYSDDDIEFLKTLAENEKAKLITTEKDFVKLPEDFKKELEVLKIEINFSGGTIGKSLKNLY